MSNFFALLNDSDDEEPKVAVKKTATPKNPKPAAPVVKAIVGAPAPVVLEPSKKGPKNDKYDKRDSNTREKKEFSNTKTGANDGKRQFERKSGTGRGKEVSKGGNGSRNWGSDKQEAEKAEGAPVAVEGEEVAAVVEEVVAVEVVPEEVDNTQTYDQYIAAKEAAKANSEIFAKLNIKEVVNEFAKAPVKGATAQELEDFLVMGEGKKLRKKGGEAKAVKQTLEVAFKVKDSSVFTESEGGDRGGRGAGRGGDRGGRGGGRGDRPERPPRAEGEARPERRERREGEGGRGAGGRGPRPARGEGGRGAPRSGPVNVLDASSFPSLS